MTHPIRIAYCITELDPGGAERAFVRLVCGLDRDKWLPEVYCLGPEGELATPIREAGIPVTCFGFTSRNVLRGLFRLRQELRRQKPEILQTFLFHANLLGRLAAVGTSVKHVVCGVRVAERRAPRYLMIEWYLKLDRLKLDRWTDRWVSKHVCVSQSVASFTAEAGIPAEKLIVIPNGVDVARFDQTIPVDLAQFGIPGDAYTILSAGRLDPQKGFLSLLNAFDAFCDDHPKSHLVIAGEGSQRPEIEAEIRDLRHLEGRIHLIGHRHDLPAILKACDLFVLASYWEGMPNVVLEAAAAAIPVLATDVEGVAEILGGKVDQNRFRYGWRSELRNNVHLYEQMRIVAGSPLEARQLAENAREFVRSEFSWERMVARYDDLYSSLLGVSSQG